MRIAVLGCGSIGRRHLQNLINLGQTNLTAFDPVPAACEAVEREFDVNCHTSLEKVWAQNPSVALITAPSNLHIELARSAARHGCHLFIEKPLSHSLDGVDSLCAEVEGRNLTTMVACNMRFHPGPATVKRLIDEEVIGQIIAARIQSSSFLPSWRPGQDYRQSYSASPAWGGAILDCIHEIDLALWYFGCAEVIGAAQLEASTIGLRTDGLAEILLHHETGVLSSVHLNFIQRDYRRCCQIIGSEGSIYWDFSTHRVTVYGSDGQIQQTIPEPDGWELNHMYVDEMTHFLRCVQDSIATMNSISGGLAALRIALAARKNELRANI